MTDEEILWYAGDHGLCMKGEPAAPDRDDWTFDREAVLAFARAIARLALSQPKDEAIDEPLDQLMPFTVRTSNCLAAEQVKTLRELSLWTEHDLLKVPNLGRKSVNEIKAVLAHYGFALSEVSARDMSASRLHTLERRVELLERRLAAIESQQEEEWMADRYGPPCSLHPDAPHGFDRNASHNAGRYVCECEGWLPAGG